MNNDYKCFTCEMTYPVGRIVFKCDVKNCQRNSCEHNPICGLCLLTSLPSGAKVNVEALLEIL